MLASRNLFIFGLGFSGTAFARRSLADFDHTGGTVRASDKASQLQADGINAMVFDGEPREEIRATLATTTHLVVSIGPGGDGDPVLRHFRRAIVAAPRLRWIGYLSTVGVYGDHGGAWVDEKTECRPVSQRSIERLEAEAGWQALAADRNIPLAVLRLAGIYGPGRNALVQLADGTARRLIKPGQVFNRIHVDDIAATLLKGAVDERSGIVNVTDNEPAPPQDVVAFAAAIGGYPAPPEIAFEVADLTPMARSFYGENKRVSNRKLREEWGMVLAYPTYREGLLALAEQPDRHAP